MKWIYPSGVLWLAAAAAAAQAPASQPGPTAVLEGPGPAEAAQAELSPIMSAGVITAVRCQGNAIDVTLQVGADVYTLHSSDVRQVPFASESAPNVPVAACTMAPGRRARVQFKPNADAARHTGTLVAVRLLP